MALTDLKKLNKNHLDNCVCFSCRPSCRGRYTINEWENVLRTQNGRCKHCDNAQQSHAGCHWMAGNIIPAGACTIKSIREAGIKSNAFSEGDFGHNFSDTYVFEPKETS